jgi:hypothetical protein
MDSRSAKKILAAISILVSWSVFAKALPPPQLGQKYAGDEACCPCHAAKFETYYQTAHHLTSRAPTRESILGSFNEKENTLRTSNPNLHFRMEATAGSFYETAVSSDPGVSAERTERISVVIGSGRVGQTYLYWKNNLLFQLPVSYWTDLGTWVNSPGYRDGEVKFERPVVPRCLECHLSYAVPTNDLAASNEYKPESLVFGISCERCHGPGLAHVKSLASKNEGDGMLRFGELTRERQMDVCAQCHGGRRFPLTAAFSYIPGEPLDKYYVRDPSNAGAVADVHGNQVALLQASRCYQSSAALVCSTCHDVHQTQRDAAAFSVRCRECHKPENCGKYEKLHDRIVTNCVDCHMPVQASKLIVSSSNGKKTRAMVRTHWIKIYDQTEKPGT